MKRRLTVVILVITIIGIMIFGLVGCNAPETLNDAVARLEKYGYTVNADEGSGIINFYQTDNNKISATAKYCESEREAKKMLRNVDDEMDSMNNEINAKVKKITELLQSDSSLTYDERVALENELAELTKYEAMYSATTMGKWCLYGHTEAVADFLFDAEPVENILTEFVQSFIDALTDRITGGDAPQGGDVPQDEVAPIE